MSSAAISVWRLRIKPAEKSQLAVVVQFLSVFYGIALFMGLQQLPSTFEIHVSLPRWLPSIFISKEQRQLQTS